MEVKARGDIARPDPNRRARGWAGKVSESRLETHMLKTYTSLRRLIIAVTLVFLAALALYRGLGDEKKDSERRDSISAYYYHPNDGFPMQELFVGCLAAAGVMLIAYQGYTEGERVALNLAGIFLILVVYFPMDWDQERNAAAEVDLWEQSWHAWVHYVSAFAFFLCLAYVSMFRSLDTLAIMGDRALRRAYAGWYRFTGILMILVAIAAVVLQQTEWRADWLFLVEYLGVAAFLLYWIGKSVEMLWGHQPPAPEEGAGPQPGDAAEARSLNTPEKVRELDEALKSKAGPPAGGRA